MATARRKKPKRLALSGEMTIYRAAELKLQMLDSLNAAETLEIDLSAVSELDSAGVQLMLLLQREASANGKTMTWTHHSEAVSEVLTLLNLDSMLGNPVSIVWS